MGYRRIHTNHPMILSRGKKDERWEKVFFIRESADGKLAVKVEYLEFDLTFSFQM